VPASTRTASSPTRGAWRSEVTARARRSSRPGHPRSLTPEAVPGADATVKALTPRGRGSSQRLGR
jgi:hypothetical protein